MPERFGMGVRWPLGNVGFGGDGGAGVINNITGSLFKTAGMMEDRAAADKKAKAAETARQEQLDQQATLGAWTKLNDQMKTPGLPRAVQHQLYTASRPIAEKLGFELPEIALEEWQPSYAKLFDQATQVLKMPGTYDERQQRLNAMLADAAGDPAVAAIVKRQEDALKAQRAEELGVATNLAFRVLADQATPEERSQYLAMRAIANAPDTPETTDFERRAKQERALLLFEAEKGALGELDARAKRRRESVVKFGENERGFVQDPMTGEMKQIVKGAAGPPLSQPLKDALSADGFDVRDLDPSNPKDAAIIARARRQVEDDARIKAVKDAEALIPAKVKEKRALAGVKTPEDRRVSETAITAMRSGFTAGAKTFVDVRDAYARVQASAREPSAAGDLSLIFNYMKILDPGSVIRESEFAQAAAAGSYGDRIAGLVQRATNGQRLSDNVREDFVDRADKLFKAQLSSYTKLEDEYRRIAKERGIEPSNVIIDYAGDFRSTGKKDDAKGAAAADPTKLTDDEIMRRLRSAAGR